MSYWSYKSYLVALLLLALPVVVGAYHTDGHNSIVTCGFNGPDCSLCSFLELAQSLLNFTLKIVVPSVAVILVIWAGYLYLTAGPRPDNVKKAQSTFKNIFIGLVIAVAAYSATSFLLGWLGQGSNTDFGFRGGVFTLQCTDTSPAINTGDFVKNGVISFELSEPEPQIKEGRLDPPVQTQRGYIQRASNSVNVGNLKSLVQEGVIVASGIARDNGIELVVTDGFRTVDEQKKIAAENCDLEKDPNKCVRRSGKPEACVPQGDGKNCRHTTGDAVDIKGRQNQKQCPGGSACQNAVIKIMQDRGFCVYEKEDWHFELKVTLEKDPARMGKFICKES